MNAQQRSTRTSRWSWFGLATKLDLQKTQQIIMEKVQQVAASVQEALTKIHTSVTGITEDIHALKSKIDQLQTTPDGWTPEDGVALDNIQTGINALVDKLEALDAATENLPVTDPVVPTPTPSESTKQQPRR